MAYSAVDVATLGGELANAMAWGGNLRKLADWATAGVQTLTDSQAFITEWNPSADPALLANMTALANTLRNACTFNNNLPVLWALQAQASVCAQAAAAAAAFPPLPKSSLFALIDAENAASIVNDGTGGCTSITDTISGAVFAGSATKPQIVASHPQTHRQVIQTDGAASCFTATPAPASYISSAPFEWVWIGVQDNGASVGGNGTFLVQGGTGGNQKTFALNRFVSNVCQCGIGNGTTQALASTSAASPLAFGPMVICGYSDGVNISINLQGVQGNPAAAGGMPSLDATRFRINANASLSPANFVKGALSLALGVRGVLSAADRANVVAWAGANRLGV